jgi:hypothetical protein
MLVLKSEIVVSFLRCNKINKSRSTVPHEKLVLVEKKFLMKIVEMRSKREMEKTGRSTATEGVTSTNKSSDEYAHVILTFDGEKQTVVRNDPVTC